MSRTIEVTINKCTECPLRREHSGHGEWFIYCSHKQAPGGYDNVIPITGRHGPLDGDVSLYPSFCPLKENP